MTKSKYIFEQLARPGECWHSLNQFPAPYARCIYCKQIFKIPDDGNLVLNPDFSKPEGREWAIERCIEKEISVWTWFDTPVKLVLLTGFTYKKIIYKTYTDYCLGFEDALYNFLKGGRT